MTNRNEAVSTIRHSVANTNATAPGVRSDAVNITVVPDIRRNASKISEDTYGQNLRVGTIRPLPVTERLPDTA